MQAREESQSDYRHVSVVYRRPKWILLEGVSRQLAEEFLSWFPDSTANIVLRPLGGTNDVFDLILQDDTKECVLLPRTTKEVAVIAREWLKPLGTELEIRSSKTIREQSLDRYESLKKTLFANVFQSLYRLIVGTVLVGVIIMLIIAAGWVFVVAAPQAFHHYSRTQSGLVPLNNTDFVGKLTSVINAALLIVILLELVETVRVQLRQKERLYPDLVRNFLVIGIVSEIRHMLTTGAELSLLAPTQYLETHHQLLTDLGINAGVVVALTTGLWLAHRSSPRHYGALD
jgi:hypothetical protein